MVKKDCDHCFCWYDDRYCCNCESDKKYPKTKPIMSGTRSGRVTTKDGLRIIENGR